MLLPLFNFYSFSSSHHISTRFSPHHTHRSLECARLFADRGIPTKVVLDAAVAAVMEEVDLCLVGAEGVMENGGIVNKVRV